MRRRPSHRVTVDPVVGSALSALSFLIASGLETNGVPWLFVGRIISGITAASFSAAYAYIADVTPAEKRAQSLAAVRRTPVESIR